MLNAYVMIGLATVIAIIMILCAIFYTVLWSKNQTKVNANILWYILLFTMGIVVDCARTAIIFGVEERFPDLDFSTYIVKIITTFLAFAMVSEVHIALSHYVGYPKKRESFLRYYLITLAIIFSIASVIWSFTTTPVGEYDFYLYQLEPILYFIIFLAYLPVAAFLFFRNWSIIRSVRNKKIYYKFLTFTILTLILIGERGFNLGGYTLVNLILNIPIELSLLLDFLALAIISFMFFAVILKYDIFQEIGSYFSIKKLYILKDNGILIFEYDFENQRFRDGLTSEDTLMAGFIYAVTETFKEILKSDEQINSFSSGNRSVLVQRGKYIFGVLVVTEDSRLLHDKLIDFITRYEAHFEDDLRNWTGEYSKFDRLVILDWIFEILREN